MVELKTATGVVLSMTLPSPNLIEIPHPEIHGAIKLIATVVESPTITVKLEGPWPLELLPGKTCLVTIAVVDDE